MEPGELDDNRPLYATQYLNQPDDEVESANSTRCAKCANDKHGKTQEIDRMLGLYTESKTDNHKLILQIKKVTREAAKYKELATTSAVKSNRCADCEVLKLLIEKLAEHAKNKIESLENKLQENDMTINDMKAAILHLKETNAAMNSKIENGSLQKQLQLQETTLADLKATFSDLQKKHAALPTKANINSLEKKIKEKDATIDDMEATISDLEKRNTALSTKISNMNVDGEVDKIVNHKKRKGKDIYLIQWKDTWLSAENLNCESKLKQYHKSRKC